MKIAIISEFSPRVCDYSKIESLCAKGMEVELFTNNRFKSYYSNKKFKVNTYDNMPDNQEYLLDVIKSHKDQKFDFLVANHEFDLITIAKLRELLEIPGQSFISALDFRDKYLMKKKVKEVVSVPNFAKIGSNVELIDFISKNGFPVVIKPRMGAGSSDVKILRNSEDLREQLKHGDKNIKFMVESFIDGLMYHVDGIFNSIDIQAVTVSKYYNNCLSFQDNKALGSFIIDDTNPDKKRLIQEVDKVLHKLETPLIPIVFHAELFIKPNGSIVFCEIASRVGGGRVNSVFEISTGINLQEYFVESQICCENKLENLTNIKAGWIIFPPKTGKLVSVNLLSKSWLREVNFDKESIGKVYDGAQFSGSALISYVVEGKDEKELFERMEFIEKFQESNTIYTNQDGLNGE